jgi:hypothetical protein
MAKTKTKSSKGRSVAQDVEEGEKQSKLQILEGTYVIDSKSQYGSAP